jgi:Tfp pilus assembly protein PilF
VRGGGLARGALAGLALAALCSSCSSGRRKASPAELYLTERTATVLLRQGQAREAESAFRQALVDDPNNAEMRDGLGSALLMEGRAKEALPEFDRAVSIDPNHYAYRINRGVALLQLDRVAEAEHEFSAALQSANIEDQKAALLNLGRVRFRTKDYAGADKNFTRLLTLDPKNIPAFMARAEVYEAERRDDAAMTDYLSVLRIDSQNIDANMRMGLILLSLHQNDLGRRYLKRVTDLAPDSAEAARARLLLAGEGSGESPFPRP